MVATHHHTMGTDGSLPYVNFCNTDATRDAEAPATASWAARTSLLTMAPINRYSNSIASIRASFFTSVTMTGFFGSGFLLLAPEPIATAAQTVNHRMQQQRQADGNGRRRQDRSR